MKYTVCFWWNLHWCALYLWSFLQGGSYYFVALDFLSVISRTVCPLQVLNIWLFHLTLILSLCSPCLHSRRIFGIRFKITSSTTPDDSSIGSPYISLHQPTKLLYLASASLGQLPQLTQQLTLWLLPLPSSWRHSPAHALLLPWLQ